MLKTLGKVTKRLLKFVLELTAAGLGLTVIMFGLLVWRAGSGPITIDTLAPELAGLLSNPATGIRTEIGHALIMWDREAQALRLVTTTVKIYDRTDKLLAELPQLSLGLNFLAPLRDQGAPLEIFSHDFSIHLLRETDGSFHFGGLHFDETGAAGDESGNVKDYLRTLLRLNTKWLGLGQVGAVKVEHITVLVTDRTVHKDWGLKFPYINLVRSTRGLTAKAWVVADQSSGGSSIILDASYNSNAKMLEAQASFADLNTALWVDRFPQMKALAIADLPLSGSVTVRLDDTIAPISAQIGVSGQSGHLALPAFMPKPIQIKSLLFQADIDFITHQLTLKQADLDVNGIKLAVSGSAIPTDAAQPEKLHATVNASIKDWPLDRLADVWPESIVPNPRTWIAHNMSVGKFTNLSALANFNIDWRNPDDVQDFKLAGKLALENATIRYIDGMPAVTGVNAEADADQSTLKINVKGGTVDHLILGASPIVIDGLDGKDQNITVNLAGKNSVTDVLRLIDHPPLNYAKKLGILPQQMTGLAALDIKFKFPLIKVLPLEKMQIDARAKITDFASDKLVRGLAIKNGALDLVVDQVQLQVKGNASFNNIPLSTQYRQAFAGTGSGLQSEAELKGALSPADWAALGLDLGKDAKGDTPVTIKYAKGYASPAALDLTADLTPVSLSFPMLNWSKSADKAASAHGRLIFGTPELKIAPLELKGTQLNVVVNGTLDTATMRPKALLCKPCIIGHNDVVAKIGYADGAPSFEISGAVLDYRGDPSPPSQNSAPPKPLQARIDVERLYLADAHFFTKLHTELRRDTMGWNFIDFRGMAEGRVPITATLKPDGSKAPLRLSVVTDDFGELLRAADITDQVHDGKLQIIGFSTFAHPRRIEGTIKIKNYKVQKLPFLAVLLNAASFTGFADMLGGGGIGFDRLEANYVWEGAQLKLDDMRTSGGALGLNLDGSLDFDTNQGDFQGTVVPFSFFSNIIGNIPIVGDILTGGSGGGVFAVTYRAKGDLGNLKFDVNPVSVLTPGILRRIFFQGR